MEMGLEEKKLNGYDEKKMWWVGEWSWLERERKECYLKTCFFLSLSLCFFSSRFWWDFFIFPPRFVLSLCFFVFFEGSVFVLVFGSDESLFFQCVSYLVVVLSRCILRWLAVIKYDGTLHRQGSIARPWAWVSSHHGPMEPMIARKGARNPS